MVIRTTLFLKKIFSKTQAKPGQIQLPIMPLFWFFSTNAYMIHTKANKCNEKEAYYTNNFAIQISGLVNNNIAPYSNTRTSQ